MKEYESALRSAKRGKQNDCYKLGNERDNTFFLKNSKLNPNSLPDRKHR